MTVGHDVIFQCGHSGLWETEGTQEWADKVAKMELCDDCYKNEQDEINAKRSADRHARYLIEREARREIKRKAEAKRKMQERVAQRKKDSDPETIFKRKIARDIARANSAQNKLIDRYKKKGSRDTTKQASRIVITH
jgi:hypothetical protein